MGFLQRWLDEDDAAIARFTRVFYLLTFAFMALFGVQLVLLVFVGDGPVARSEVGPLAVSLFLTLTMYNLAIDGRRSRKAMKARREPQGP